MAALRILIDILKSNRPSDWPLYLSTAVVWQVRKRLGHRFETRLHNGAIVQVYPSSRQTEIFYTRYPEGADLAFIRRHSGLADTFVDVGANVGIFSASLFDKF